jgi:RNA polymerase sigma factor (sigma-70 family)
LLHRFLADADEAAFEALVRRHGPMVLGVCRRVLKHPHDAEDAFQATFLVLVRKAVSIRKRDTVGGWLYGVACKTALKARAADLRRQAKERQAGEMRGRQKAEEDAWADLQPLLDQELGHLPDKYRLPVVLCDLEGKTRKEAARELGWVEGTLSGRLARARQMLAQRLARRRVVLSGGLLATMLSQHAASACVPAALLAATVQAAGGMVAGQALAAGLISAKVAALTKGVLNTMFLTRLKIATAMLLAAALLVGTTGTLTVPAEGARAAGEKAKAQKVEPRKEEKPALVQVRLVSPASMKVRVQNQAGQFDRRSEVEVPARLNLEPGKCLRLKLADIPNRPGVEVFPTVEIAKPDAVTETFQAVSAVPIAFTEEDFDQVASGNVVVKVIYLPSLQFRDLASTGVDEVVSSRLEPGVDPIVEAQRRGRVLLVLRVGNIDLGGKEGGAGANDKICRDEPLDAFIRRHLEKKVEKQTEEEANATFIRRLSLDVTGVPPTPAEVKRFLQDKDPDKRKKLVERLLLVPEVEAKIEAFLKKLPNEELRLHALDLIEKKVKEQRDKIKKQPGGR